MDSTVPILEYGRRPRRRRWRLAFAGFCLLLIGVAGVRGWQQRQAIRAYAQNKYADWQFARAFDRAERELMGDGDTWLASVDPQRPDKRAEQQLDTLLAMCSPPPASGLPISREDGTGILFVRKGQTGGHRWLAFACTVEDRMWLWTFERGNRVGPGEDRFFEITDRADADAPRYGFQLRAIRRVGGDIQTSMDNTRGGHNAVLWSIAAQSKPSVYPFSWGYPTSPLVTCTVTPDNGWVDSHTTITFWYPDTADWRLLQGHAPRRELAVDKGAIALAFVPDGRLAWTTLANLQLINLNTGERTTFPLPPKPDIWCSPAWYDDQSNLFTFSRDGSKVFVTWPAFPKAQAWLVDAMTGNMRTLAKELKGIPQTVFPDNRSLIVTDYESRIRIDWDTGKIEPLVIAGIKNNKPVLDAVGDIVGIQTGEDAADVIDLHAKQVMKSVRCFDELSISPDGRWITADNGQCMRQLSTDLVLIMDDFAVCSRGGRLKWSADGTRAVGAGDDFVYVFSMREPRCIARFPNGLAIVRTQVPASSGGSSFSFSSSGGAGGGTTEPHACVNVAISPDGHSMAACSEDSTTISYWPDIDAAIGPGK